MASKATRAEMDPTGQAGTRRRANQDNNRRLNDSAREVLAIWRNVKAKKTTRKKIINQESDTLDFYVYDLTPQQRQNLALDVSDSVNENMETEGDIPPLDWYHEQYVEQAYRGGTIQENSTIAVLLALIAGSVVIETVDILLSTRYLDDLEVEIAGDYPLFDGLSSTTIKQVVRVINEGIKAGLGKRAIGRQIIERYEVAKSSAKRIVDTEINRAYNNGRTDLINEYRARGEPLAVQHISALLSTTRPHHAARHGRAYTPEQQNQWWNTGTNRINCHCSVRAIVINRDGTVRDKAAQRMVIERGKQIFERNQ